MLKTIVLATGGTVLAGTLLLGWSTFSTWARTSARLVREGAQSAVPTGFEIERIQTMVNDLDGVISRQEEKLVRQRVDHEYLKKEVARCRSQVDDLAAQVAEARRLLTEVKDTYRIGDRTFPRNRVVEEAQAKAESLLRAREILDAKTRSEIALATALAQADAQLAAARAQREGANQRLTQLHARAESIAIRTELATTLDDLPKAIDLGAFQKVGEAFARVEKDLEVQDRLLTDRTAVRPAVEVIDFVTKPHEDVLGMLDRALKKE